MRASGQFPGGELPSYITKNIITRSLGPSPTVQVDLEGPIPFRPATPSCCAATGCPARSRTTRSAWFWVACRPRRRFGRWSIWPAFAAGPTTSRRSSSASWVPKLSRPPTADASLRPLRKRSAGASAGVDVAGRGVAGHRGPAGSGPSADGIGHVSWRRRRLARPPGGNATAAASGNSIGRPPLWPRPYVRCDCTPNADLLGRFADIVRQLRRCGRERELGGRLGRLRRFWPKPPRPPRPATWPMPPADIFAPLRR